TGTYPATALFPSKRRLLGDRLWSLLLMSIVLAAVIWSAMFIQHHLPWASVLYVCWLGILTALRVFFCIIMASLIWVPLGVWIGLRPAVAAKAQPVAQFLAAFPANLLYPVVVMLIVQFH